MKLNIFMQMLVKLIMSSLYSEQLRKAIEKTFSCRSEISMMTEYDELVLDYQKN